jgi:hypothetical protein
MATGQPNWAMRATMAPGAISKINAISVPNHKLTRLVWLAG